MGNFTPSYAIYICNGYGSFFNLWLWLWGFVAIYGNLHKIMGIEKYKKHKYLIIIS